MTEEESHLTHNIFDENPPIPVVIYVNGVRRVIGQARIEAGSAGVMAHMELNSDNPELAASFLQGMSGLSLSEDEASVTESPSPHSPNDPEHVAVNHHDGLQPWCDTCKLTEGYLRPRPLIKGDDEPVSVPDHRHKPVQHQDGKPPWCNECGLTIAYLKPVSRIHGDY
jgi:hypothetical protein